MSKKLKVKFWLDDGAYIPLKGYDTDAGLDLRTPERITISPDSSEEVDTGTHLMIPDGWCGLIVAKSSLNVRNSLCVTGLVDSNYTDSITVRVYNHDLNTSYTFGEGDKVAQIMFVEVPKLELTCMYVQKEGRRGYNGFGSTGR